MCLLIAGAASAAAAAAAAGKHTRQYQQFIFVFSHLFHTPMIAAATAAGGYGGTGYVAPTVHYAPAPGIN